MKASIDTISASEDIYYPDSDGQPLAENTIQLKWIVLLFENLRNLFSDQVVFIAADLFWYPVKGDAKTRVAPDVMVTFGRPKGDRSSYKQWEEENMNPQVVIEVLSPGNTANEMIRKHIFYQKYGVEEYLIIDPDKEEVFAYERQGELLLPKEGEYDRWQSPRLGILIEKVEGKLKAYYPDKAPFLTLEEMNQLRNDAKLEAEVERKRAEQENQKARAETLRADEESIRADKEHQRAEQILQQSIQQLHKTGMSISELAILYGMEEKEIQRRLS